MQSTQCQPIRPADLTPKLITEHHHHHHCRVFTINNSTIYTVPSEHLRLTHFGMTLSGEKETKRKGKKKSHSVNSSAKSWFTHGLLSLQRARGYFLTGSASPRADPVSCVWTSYRYYYTMKRSNNNILLFVHPPSTQTRRMHECTWSETQPQQQEATIELRSGQARERERNSSVDSLQIHCTTPLDKNEPGLMAGF